MSTSREETVWKNCVYMYMCVCVCVCVCVYIYIYIYIWAESVDWYLLDEKRAKDGALSQGNKLAGSKRRGIEYVSDYLVPVTLP